MSAGATARLFVAVEVPASVSERLAAWGRSVAGVLRTRPRRGPGAALRVLEPRSLHLTLCFLGARPVHEIEAIGATIGACPAAVGELSIGAPLWLPPRRPQALAVEVHDRGGELGRLQRSLGDAIAASCGWEAERRRFRAHVTIARIRGGARGGGSSADSPALPATPQASFTPARVILYRSWLSPAGASYEPLATRELDPAEG